MREIRLKAMGKINLGLDVLRKREDGYHDLRMIMQTVRLHDKLTLTKTRAKGIRVATNLSFLPVDENNLVYKAAKLLLDEFAQEEGLYIKLEKHIPVAAGMAGGSSDAAAVMVGVNRLFGLGLSMQELCERGVKIGADVPYCVMRGTALAEGIGEVLTPLPAMPACRILIAKPKIHVSTKAVYKALRADEIAVHPDIDGQIKAIEEGDLEKICALMGNVLEDVTIPEHPEIAALKEIMIRGGALGSMMSGSGPTVFGIFDDERKAEETCEVLRRDERAAIACLTQPFNSVGKYREKR